MRYTNRLAQEDHNSLREDIRCAIRVICIKWLWELYFSF